MLRASLALISLVWAASVAAQTHELHLVEELRIGSVEGLGADVFGDIDDIAVDVEGRIWILDPGMRSVRLFDRDGRFVREIAPHGEGPGERRYVRDFFFSPSRVTWDKSRGWLWIDDGLQFQIMDSLGVEHARDVRRPGFIRNRNPIGKVVAVDAQNRIYEQQIKPAGDTTFSYVARGVYMSNYETRYSDTLMVDARADVASEPETSLRRTDNAIVTTVVTTARPERDEYSWTVSPDGTVWLADDERRLYQLTFMGDRIPVVELDAVAAEIDVSPEHWVWIRRAPVGPKSTWELLDNCGMSLGSVSVPYPVSVTEIGPGGEIHVVAADALGVESVLRLRLNSEVRKRTC